jgi:hypothetical protein
VFRGRAAKPPDAFGLAASVILVESLVAVTGLLKPARARIRPPKQRANPVKMRELKNAADEVSFVFMDVVFFLF